MDADTGANLQWREIFALPIANQFVNGITLADSELDADIRQVVYISPVLFVEVRGTAGEDVALYFSAEFWWTAGGRVQLAFCLLTLLPMRLGSVQAPQSSGAASCAGCDLCSEVVARPAPWAVYEPF